jgi:integrase
MFDRAIVDGLVRTNPASRLVKPRRARSRRRALTDRELGELIGAVRATSRDPDLDLLLIRFHLESGARRDGALNLRHHDIDERRATVWLHEKFDTEREQPVSPSLIRLLQHHCSRRGADRRDAPVFHTANGKPMSTRRPDRVFELARNCLPWAERTPVSAHVLRHTAINAVGRLAGEPVAARFAGHTPSTITGRYLYASIEEVAEAVAELTGEPHPLAIARNGNGVAALRL